MRPDKLLELLDAQSRWNLLPRLASGHFDLQSIGILADSSGATGTRAPWPFQPTLPVAKNPQPVVRDRLKLGWMSKRVRRRPPHQISHGDAAIAVTMPTESISLSAVI
jgi:hypothetical protein